VPKKPAPRRTSIPKAVSAAQGTGEWQSLYQAYNAMFKAQESALIPQGISLPQLQLLGLLARERRPVTITQLAKWMVKEPNSLTGLVDRTEAKGWVHTHGDPKDRRKRLVEFTNAGVKKFQEASAVANQAGEKLFGKLSQSEKTQLKASCEKIRDAAVAGAARKPAARG
jgi:DNA-binding MarR family transcriptional regulator